MDLTLYLIDGQKYDYAVEGDEETRILQSVHPNRLVSSLPLTLHTHATGHLLNPGAIEQIDFGTDQDVDWNSPFATRDMEALSESTYRQRFQEKVPNLVRARSEKKPGEECEVLAELLFRSGRTVFLHFTEILPLKVDAREELNVLYSGGQFAAKREQGGWSIFNTANVLAVKFTPNGTEFIETDWQVDDKQSPRIKKGGAAPASPISAKETTTGQTLESAGSMEDETRKDTDDDTTVT